MRAAAERQIRGNSRAAERLPRNGKNLRPRGGIAAKAVPRPEGSCAVGDPCGVGCGIFRFLATASPRDSVFFIASESFAKGVQIRIRWFSFFFVCNVVSERTTFLPQSNRFTFSFVFGFVTAFPNERSAVLWAVYVGV